MANHTPYLNAIARLEYLLREADALINDPDFKDAANRAKMDLDKPKLLIEINIVRASIKIAINAMAKLIKYMN